MVGLVTFSLKRLPSSLRTQTEKSRINFRQHFVFVQIVKIYQFILPKKGDESYGGAVLLPGDVLPPLLHQPQGRGHLRGRLHGHQRHTESELQKQPKVIYRQNAQGSQGSIVCIFYCVFSSDVRMALSKRWYQFKVSTKLM